MKQCVFEVDGQWTVFVLFVGGRAFLTISFSRVPPRCKIAMFMCRGLDVGVGQVLCFWLRMGCVFSRSMVDDMHVRLACTLQC